MSHTAVQPSQSSQLWLSRCDIKTTHLTTSNTDIFNLLDLFHFRQCNAAMYDSMQSRLHYRQPIYNSSHYFCDTWTDFQKWILLKTTFKHPELTPLLSLPLGSTDANDDGIGSTSCITMSVVRPRPWRELQGSTN